MNATKDSIPIKKSNTNWEINTKPSQAYANNRRGESTSSFFFLRESTSKFILQFQHYPGIITTWGQHKKISQANKFDEHKHRISQQNINKLN